MEVGDKSWMNLQRSTNENIHGVNGFLDKAFERAFQGHEEDNCPNIKETFWRETNDDIGSSEKVLEVDVRWSREDLLVDIIDLPTLAQHSEDVAMETSEEEDDFDDTDWDWMEADD
uniref:Uncharacterized protein n=1 Tax=Solanum lycopersicum TaxID=4081 RepID=A0A3Q7JTW0_SOLLC